MRRKNITIYDAKKISYVCLTLFSTVLPIAGQELNSLFDCIEQPSIGDTIMVWKRKKGFLRSAKEVG